MNANTRTETRRAVPTATRGRVLAIWLALVAAMATACGGGTNTIGTVASESSPSSHTTPENSVGATTAEELSGSVSGQIAASQTGCVAHQRPNHAATVTRTHSSSRLRYQLEYPAGWRLTKACRPWRFGEPGDQSVPGTTDVYQSPGRPAFVVSSEAIPAGMTLARWLPTYVPAGPPMPPCWPAPRDWARLRIAGHPARLRGQNVYCNATEAVTVVGRRAYVFTGYPNGHGCCLFDQARFNAFLASVAFPSDTASKASS
jgi:hypothetical protein